MKCPHDRRELRVRKGLRGLVEQEQCLDCLRGVGTPSFALRHSRGGLFYWKRKRQPTRRRRHYLARLKHPSWRKLRREVMIRDNFMCRLCGEEATEVHHLTYRRLGHEPLEDLIAVCRDCNQDERVA